MFLGEKNLPQDYIKYFLIIETLWFLTTFSLENVELLINIKF